MPATATKPKPRRKNKPAPTSTRAGVDAAELRDRFGLPRRTFARVLGVSERTLAGLESGGAITDAVRRRLAEADRLHRGLVKVIKPTALPAWLDTPNDAFAGLKPIELIERGESDRLWQMLFELRSGNPV
jgi:transcriptional regulator with XRE-family HTH domain